MSVAELKTEVMNELAGVNSEAVLQDVLNLLKKENKEYDLMPHVENIVSEREEVMKKLAQ